MRRIDCLLLAAVLCACSSSEEEGTPAVSGTIMGAQFTPVGTGAIVTAPVTCALPGGLGTRSVASVTVAFASAPDLCGFLETTGACGDIASSLVITAQVIRAPASGTAAPIGPGTYELGTFFDPQNNLLVGQSYVTKVDAACVDAADIPTATGGTITFDAVSPRVVGTLDITYSDGSRLAGGFDMEACGATLDFCALLNDACPSSPCCTSPTTCP